MEEKFDLVAWKNQADKALETLVIKRTETKTVLDELDAEITQMKNALGYSEPLPKRARLRKPILDLVKGNSEPVFVATIVNSLAVNGITPKQVSEAVARTVRECEDVFYVDPNAEESELAISHS